MRFRSLHKWNLDTSLNGLLFFAQRMDELLFDYTLDSYKPSALNAPFLCVEALRLVDDIENTLIEPGNLLPVLQELMWSVRSDKIAKALLDVDLDYYVLTDEGSSLDAQRKRLEALSRTLHPARYLEMCKKQLRISVQLSNKRDIDHLARTIATTLINIGYSKPYLYNVTLNHFFVGDEPSIGSLSALDEYLNCFDAKLHGYEVLFLVDPLVKEVEDSVGAFNIEIFDELSGEYADLVSEVGFNKDEETRDFDYVLVKRIKAFDPHSARASAEAKIDNLSDLFSLFHHKNQISWGRQAVVRKLCCDKLSHLVRPHKSAMQKGFDYRPAKASKALNKLILTFSLTEKGSFKKFNRAADLHGICISNDVIENQLVNLWTAIETLVPSHVGSSKIRAIIHFILPFIVVPYVQRLIERFVADLFSWDRHITRKVLHKVPHSRGGTIYERALNLLAIESNEGLRKELYVSLKDFQLLRFRAFRLSESVSDVERLKGLVDTHKTKVAWQIRRIYRTRNLIVHSGRTPSYTEALIENGHDYLDQVMEGIMAFSCGDYRTRTLEQAFEMAEVKRIRFERELSRLTEISESNIAFLCGRSN